MSLALREFSAFVPPGEVGVFSPYWMSGKAAGLILIVREKAHRA